MLPSFGKLYKLHEINSNSLGNVFGSTVRITGKYGICVVTINYVFNMASFKIIFTNLPFCVHAKIVCHTESDSTPPILFIIFFFTRGEAETFRIFFNIFSESETESEVRRR